MHGFVIEMWWFIKGFSRACALLLPMATMFKSINCLCIDSKMATCSTSYMSFPTQHWLLYFRCKYSEVKASTPTWWQQWSMLEPQIVEKSRNTRGYNFIFTAKLHLLDSSSIQYERVPLEPDWLLYAVRGQWGLVTMWLVVSCVVNRNRKVGANSHDPISTSTMQRHRNPNILSGGLSYTYMYL